VAAVGVEGVGRTLAEVERLGPTGTPPVRGFHPQDPSKQRQEEREQSRGAVDSHHTAEQQL
jgi:hypothetical protein